jgi:hypothetical protein
MAVSSLVGNFLAKLRLKQTRRKLTAEYAENAEIFHFPCDLGVLGGKILPYP